MHALARKSFCRLPHGFYNERVHGDDNILVFLQVGEHCEISRSVDLPSALHDEVSKTTRRQS